MKTERKIHCAGAYNYPRCWNSIHFGQQWQLFTKPFGEFVKWRDLWPETVCKKCSKEAIVITI